MMIVTLPGVRAVTATLIVSHGFDDQPGCPVCADDFSTVTWLVNRCDMSTGSCDNLPVPCPTVTTSCVQAQADNPDPQAALIDVTLFFDCRVAKLANACITIRRFLRASPRL